MVAVLSLLTAKGFISAYPTAVVVIAVLFGLNFLIARSIRSNLKITPANGGRVRLSFLLSVVIFTVAGAVTIVSFLLHPSLLLGLQTGFPILLVSYLWSIVYRLHRGTSR
jgi:hypothetical protein